MTTLTKTSPYKPLNIFDAVHNVIARGIHDQNFKDGAFRTSISCTTHITNKTAVMAAFNILLASPLLSQAEKEIFRRCRGQFMHLRNRFPGSRVPSAGETVQLAQKLEDLKGIFLKDVESWQVENEPAVEDETWSRALGKAKKKGPGVEGDDVVFGKRLRAGLRPAQYWNGRTLTGFWNARRDIVAGFAVFLVDMHIELRVAL